MVSYRLLAVDDEPLALNLIERVFAAEADVELRLATSPTKGLEIAAGLDLDVVISDQRMPEMSGLAFLARIREIRPRGHRILLTAYPDMEVALHAINDGLVYRFVLKPWDLDDMRLSIRRALEAKRLADEHERLTAQLSAQFDELVRAERLATIGRLSAGIGHEFANAATPLLMNVEMLGDELARLREASGPPSTQSTAASRPKRSTSSRWSRAGCRRGSQMISMRRWQRCAPRARSFINYIAPGAVGASTSAAGFAPVPQNSGNYPFYWVAAVDVRSSHASGTIVTLGESPTDDAAPGCRTGRSRPTSTTAGPTCWLPGCTRCTASARRLWRTRASPATGWCSPAGTVLRRCSACRTTCSIARGSAR